MFNTWNAGIDDEELQSLRAERQYMIFIPHPEDSGTFSVKVADTTSVTDDEEDEDEIHSNVSSVIIKGFMYMLDNELDYLVDKGQELIYEEYIEMKTTSFKDTNNVLVFKPKKPN
jgi:hypothetical protein